MMRRRLETDQDRLSRLLARANLSPQAALVETLGDVAVDYLEGERQKKDSAAETRALSIALGLPFQKDLQNGDSIAFEASPPDLARSLAELPAGSDLRDDIIGAALARRKTEADQVSAQAKDDRDFARKKELAAFENDLAMRLAQERARLRPPEAPRTIELEDGVYSLRPDGTRGEFLGKGKKAGGFTIDPQTGQLTPTDGVKLTSTDRKELYDTKDLLAASDAGESSLKKAMRLLDGVDEKGNKVARPFSGFGAEAKAFANRIPLIGSRISDDEAAATTEYKTLITEQALNSLKAIFGGMPTEGERKILLDMQAATSYTPKEQRRIIENALSAINARKANSKQKLQAILTGDYSSFLNDGDDQ